MHLTMSIAHPKMVIMVNMVIIFTMVTKGFNCPQGRNGHHCRVGHHCRDGHHGRDIHNGRGQTGQTTLKNDIIIDFPGNLVTDPRPVLKRF